MTKGPRAREASVCGLAYLGKPDGRAGEEAVDERVLEADVAVEGHSDFLLLVGEKGGRFEAGRVGHKRGIEQGGVLKVTRRGVVSD